MNTSAIKLWFILPISTEETHSDMTSIHTPFYFGSDIRRAVISWATTELSKSPATALYCKMTGYRHCNRISRTLLLTEAGGRRRILPRLYNNVYWYRVASAYSNEHVPVPVVVFDNEQHGPRRRCLYCGRAARSVFVHENAFEGPLLWPFPPHFE